ncbi:MAG: 50S ribosomal protein L22 [Candidatus Thermoplasmatota archaeon]|nr:50S ribosomal protein L22 [Candidatus Thermoplasmatota archaeon]
MPKYSAEKQGENSARAYGYELHCSPKDAMNVAYALRGMKVDPAKKYLEDVIALKRPVPAVYHKQKRLHQKGIGPGSFPKKAASYMLKVLENAENNAEYKGFDVESMTIKHIAAYQGRIIKGMMPRAHGRATDKNETTTNVEIILQEVE